MSEARSISWMPSWVHTAELSHFEIPAGDAQTSWHCARPRPDGWSALGDGLRKAQSVLKKMTIAEIVAAIDKVSERWGDRSFEPRIRARDEVVLATGFSPEAVERSFDVELRNYRADSLWRALRRELGDPEVLDGFRPDVELQGRGMAIGPRITLGVFTGNVPGLPALSLVRALLVKSAVIAKVASGEPSFAARFVRTIHAVEPCLADAIVVTYWDRNDEASLRGALGQADAVIAYGGEDAVAAIRARIGPHQRYVEHGHKLSAGIVTERYLHEVGADEAARRIAVDVSTFNQHACIAPQAYLVEGDTEHARGFAARVARALSDYAGECPLGTLDEADASSIQLRRATDAWLAVAREGRDLWCASGLDWTVILDTDLTSITGTGNRVLRMIPVSSLDHALSRLQPIARHLQNVGVGALGEELWRAATQLAELGACRVSEPGRMAEPSMIWRHDGITCIAALVRWCDVEMHRELEAETRQAAAKERA